MDPKPSLCKSEPRDVVITCVCVCVPIGWPAPQEPLLLHGPSHSAWHAVGLGTCRVSGRWLRYCRGSLLFHRRAQICDVAGSLFSNSPLALTLFSMKVFLTEWGSHVPSLKITLHSLPFHWEGLKLSSGQWDLRRNLMEILEKFCFSNTGFVHSSWRFLLSLPRIWIW